MSIVLSQRNRHCNTRASNYNVSLRGAPPSDHNLSRGLSVTQARELWQTARPHRRLSGWQRAPLPAGRQRDREPSRAEREIVHRRESVWNAGHTSIRRCGQARTTTSGNVGSTSELAAARLSRFVTAESSLTRDVNISPTRMDLQ